MMKENATKKGMIFGEYHEWDLQLGLISLSRLCYVDVQVVIKLVNENSQSVWYKYHTFSTWVLAMRKEDVLTIFIL